MLVLTCSELVDLDVPQLNGLSRFLVLGSEVARVILLQAPLVNQVAISSVLMRPLSLLGAGSLLLSRWSIFVKLSSLNLRIFILILLNIWLGVILVQGELLIALWHLRWMLLSVLKDHPSSLLNKPVVGCLYLLCLGSVIIHF